jgi:arylsulfatase A-like enzyme
MVDDLGLGDVSCYGATDVRTPNIDRIAQTGLKLTHFYANCCVCSPTRASLVSGCYPERVGVPGVIRTHPENSWGYLDPDFPTIADKMKEAGYRTALVGKWHLGLESPNKPNERGFDYFHGFLCDMIDDYWEKTRHGINYMRLNEKEIEVPGHATDLFTQWAVEYLQRQADSEEPWFLYLAYNAPHTPTHPPKDWIEKVKAREPEMDPKRVELVALVEHLDFGIGRVLDALAKSPDAENTLLVFTSDNGGLLRQGASNGPLRGGKQDMYEGGVRVPTCMRWAGHTPPGTVTDFRAMTMDLYPTFCQAAGVAIEHEIDGHSLLPLLEGKKMEPLQRDLFCVRREGGGKYQGQDYYAMLRGPWKLLHNTPFERLELYHLGEDPDESENLADHEKEIFRQMTQALRAHIQEGGRVPWQPPKEN